MFSECCKCLTAPYLLAALTSSSVCITSIMRLISLDFNATFAKDFTWATGTSVIWTQVESTASVICACLPSLGGPLARFLPSLFGSSNHNPLGNDISHRVSLQSGNWNGQRTCSRKPGEFDIEIDDPNYESGGSEVGIVGIRRTVSVELTYQGRRGGGKPGRQHDIRKAPV